MKSMFALTVLVIGLLSACQPPQSTQAKSPFGAGAATLDEKGMPARLRQDMAYADARRLLIDAGWQPTIDANCRKNVVGEDHERLCEGNPELDSCRICGEMPELSSCSGDATAAWFSSRSAAASLSRPTA